MRRDLASTDELAAADPLDRVSALCLRGYTGNQLLRDIDCVSMFQGKNEFIRYAIKPDARHTNFI